jgi:enoyl-[acyl-carrier-protein] reductase (NADH)
MGTGSSVISNSQITKKEKAINEIWKDHDRKVKEIDYDDKEDIKEEVYRLREELTKLKCFVIEMGYSCIEEE